MENIKTNSDINSNALSAHSERKTPKKLIFIASKVRKINSWKKSEDEILLEVAKKYDYRNWNAIAKFLNGRNAIQCSARYKRIKPGIVKGAWTEEEDIVLLELLKRFGKNWSLLSKYMPSRSGKQIRDRFLNTLDPNISKEKFTIEEDNLILDLYAKFGSQWSKIAKELPWRTGDMIKNRFYSSLRKQVHNDDYRETLRKKQKEKEESDAKNMNLIKFSDVLSNRISKIVDQNVATGGENKIDNSNESAILNTKTNFVSSARSAFKVYDANMNNNINSITNNFSRNINNNQNKNNQLRRKRKRIVLSKHSNKEHLKCITNNIVLPHTDFNQNVSSIEKIDPIETILNCSNFTSNMSNAITLNNLVQTNFINSLLINKSEQNLYNFNHLDLHMHKLISCISENSYTRQNFNRAELENQLAILNQLLNLTRYKLDICKNTENVGALIDNLSNQLFSKEKQLERILQYENNPNSNWFR